jgi:hypothetical protein
MQLPWDEHFLEIVIPAWQAYRISEQRLTEAVVAKDESLAAKARYNALREGGASSFYVHHFGEVVLRAQPDWLPSDLKSPVDVMRWLSSYCTMLRTDRKIDDVALLGDVADALKHAILSRRLEARQVAANDAVLVVSSGYGELNYGEGKWGGGDQVLVRARSETRALSSILQNVVDAWRRAAGIELPEIGLP